jgi:hypothetical protein
MTALFVADEYDTMMCCHSVAAIVPPSVNEMAL